MKEEIVVEINIIEAEAFASKVAALLHNLDDERPSPVLAAHEVSI